MLVKLKAILIDDEINIIRNLQQVLPWDEQRVEVVGTAKNGVQALELIHAHHPQLIFCDIRMPVMDGIEFLQELRQIDQEAEVIMLTGYQEFEYARSVLRYQVMDYVLKPIDYDALIQLFEKTVQHIRDKLQQNQYAEETQHRMKHIAYEKALLEYIRGFHREGQSGANDRLVLSDNRLALFVLELPQAEQSHSLLSDQLASVKEGMVAYAADSHVHLLHVADRFWALVLAGKLPHMNGSQLEQMMKQIVRSLDGREELAIAAYERAMTAEELYLVWNTMCKELSFAHQPYVIVRELEDTRQSNEQHIWHCADQCIAAIKHLDQAAARSSLKRMNELLRVRTMQSLQQLEMLIHSIIVYMLRELRRYEAIQSATEKQVWRQLNATSKLRELTLLITHMVEKAFSEHSNKRPQVSIHVAKDFIESHLSEDIAAEEVAQYLNISVSYFSTIFKQQYGMTFIEFVTQARIERAKSLLSITKKSISDVAKSVGYTERRYFNKVFQKRVGMLPSEYREQNGSVG